MNDWFYIANGTEVGPVSSDDLRKMIADGVLTTSSHVCKSGMPNWITAEQFLSIIEQTAKQASNVDAGTRPESPKPRISPATQMAVTPGSPISKAVLGCILLCLINLAFSGFLFFRVSHPPALAASANGDAVVMAPSDAPDKRVTSFVSSLPPGGSREVNQSFRTIVKGDLNVTIVLLKVATGRAAVSEFQALEPGMIAAGKMPTYLKLRLKNVSSEPLDLFYGDFKARDKESNEYRMRFKEAESRGTGVNPGGAITLDFVTMLPAGTPVASITYAFHGTTMSLDID